LEGVPLERLIRDALANRLTFEEVRDQVLARLDQDQEQRLQDATLAGLATRYVDLTRLRADRQRAAEERLVPAYIRAFFVQALEALAPGRLERRDDGFWRVPYVPAALREVPETIRRRHGLPGESYAALTFDKADLDAHSHLAFVGPGHPLFEAVVHHVLARYGPDLACGAVFRDPAAASEGLLWLLVGSVEDGLGRVAGKRLFALFQPLDGGAWSPVSPARLLDLEPPAGSPSVPAACQQQLGDADAVVDWSLDHVLEPYLAQLQEQRRQETDIVRDYLRRSFDVLIARSQGKLMDYEQRALRGTDMSLSLQDERRHLEDLRRRQTSRLAETERAAMLALGAPAVLGVAAIVPGTVSAPVTLSASEGSPMRRSDEVEAAAMAHAIAHEQAQDWTVADVSAEARGYDLLSHGPDDAVRYIEVKGRAGVGAVELSANEWLKAEQLGADYWLYIVTDAVRAPALHRIQDPARRLPREEVIAQVRYRVAQQGWGRVAESAAGYETTGVVRQ
ncbi:MAG: DUF3883 domain-containing protein, partial [Chloroflexi bacterium]|nr:DUF3883 domain-containing protein [Chloroflexota bacterium]